MLQKWNKIIKGGGSNENCKACPPKEKIETASLPQTSCKYDSEGFRARILNVSRVLEIGSDLVSDEHSV